MLEIGYNVFEIKKKNFMIKKTKTSDKPFYKPKKPRQNLNKPDLKNAKVPKKPVVKKREKTEEELEAEFIEKTGLNYKQEAFCQTFVSQTELFGNGVQSYIEVYKPDMTKPNWYKTACASASQILSNIKVFTRINALLEEQGFNHANSDKQLGFLMNQHADFKAKIAAIREYNRVTKRVDDAPKIPVSFEIIIAPPSAPSPTQNEPEQPTSAADDSAGQSTN